MGKTYTFGYPTGERAKGCKVVEEPRANWVKVQLREGDTATTTWVNLDLVGFITLESEGR